MRGSSSEGLEIIEKMFYKQINDIQLVRRGGCHVQKWRVTILAMRYRT